MTIGMLIFLGFSFFSFFFITTLKAEIDSMCQEVDEIEQVWKRLRKIIPPRPEGMTDVEYRDWFLKKRDEIIKISGTFQNGNTHSGDENANKG